MKKVLVFIVILSIIVTSSTFECKADTIVWSGNIELNANQLFTQEQTLIVIPGTTVTATGAYRIEVKGNILAEGTTNDPILFTASDTLGLYDSATMEGGWHGIHLLNNDSALAKFTHCRFEYGKANVPGSWYAYEGDDDTLSGNQGGALRITDYHTAEFDNCTFFYNYSRTSGGAIYCNHIQSIKVTNCEFMQNKTMVWGGGICCDNYDSLLVSNSTFKRNMAMFYYFNQFGQNFRGRGSGLYLDADYPNISYNLINNCSFFNNISLSTISFLISNSIFINNLLTNNFNLSTLTFNRVESSHHVYNNVIANNWWYTNIPGVTSGSEDLRFYNNIMWDNNSYNIEDDDMAIRWSFTQPDVNYCLIWDGRAEGENILTDNPLFANPAPCYGLESNGWEYDWTLLDNSPAVNAGTPDTNGLNLPLYDLADNPRIYGNRIDMGAYENQFVWVKINDSPVFNKSVKVYPNPGKEKLFIEIQPGMEGSWIELVDGTGKQMIHSQITTIPAILSPTGLKPGIYYYRIYNHKQVFKKGKWVKL